jgi:hypothetical protein
LFFLTSRAALLAALLADATPDTLASLHTLFPEPRLISDNDLLDYYGSAAPLCSDAQLVVVILDILRTCVGVVPPLSSTHKDGWRVEHFIPLAADPDCGEDLAAFVTTLVRGDVSQKVADLLSSAILVILLVKDAETMEKMKHTLGNAYIQL